jgi:hypothetical protein
MNGQKRFPVSLDTDIAGKGKSNYLHCRMLMCYVDTITHLLSPIEVDLIKGRLRNNDLTNAIPSSVRERLSHAQQTGSMSSNDYARLYQLCSMFKKVPGTFDEKVCKEAGFNKLLLGEESCRLVNKTIDVRKGFDHPLLDRVQRIIAEILGPLPSNFLNKVVSFGPGSSVNANSRIFAESGLFYKLSDKLIVPKRAKYYLAAHISHNGPWLDALGVHYRLQRNSDESRLSYELRVLSKHLVVVDDDTPSKISFVPKNCDEHRTIGIEMNGLMVLQKVLGNLIRDRLRRETPINLNSQERNRHLARLAKTFGLSTIDLANASNSISTAVVETLLPSDWFCALSDFRSTHGHCPSLNRSVTYEMFSSMGNGFTFELESLIFYALAKACAEKVGKHETEIKKSIGVFGDDIIVPADVAPYLIKSMSLLGFTVNEEKSFLSGFFFESCGADYYDGVDVRPFLIKREVKTYRDLLFIMNSLLYKSMKQCRSDFSDLYSLLFKLIPDKRLVGPLHFTSSKLNAWETDKLDDLESVLRVPLDIAQKLGGVHFHVPLQAWRYKKWVRVGLESNLGQSPDYFVKSIRFLTFLKGSLGGKVILRGRTRDRQTKSYTSSWDGCITVKELRYADCLFDFLR